MFCFFDSDKERYAILVICTKNLIICDFETMDVGILVDKACCFNDFSNISHYDVKRYYIENLSLDLRSEYQTTILC